jgi:hypothetical protein
MADVPYSGRRVYWCAQEQIQDWRPSDSNTAGWQDIGTDGELVCGRAARGSNLIWTTTDLWSMTYIGGDFVYSFKQEGGNCGIIAPEAVVLNDAGAFWMGFDRFFLYDGFVKVIPCEVGDYVFGRLNRTYASKVWAVFNPQFSEITWHYPSTGQTECDSYATFNFLENHWAFGALARTAGVSRQPGAALVGPILITSAGVIYDHETGNTRSGASTPYLESGPVEIGQGDTVMRVQEIVPDDKTVGDVTASIYTALSPDGAETLNGPYTLTAFTNVRLTARQVRVRIVEAVATAWRVGVIRLGLIAGGKR